MAARTRLDELRVNLKAAPSGYERMYDTIFTDEAVLFVAELYHNFEDKIDELFRRRISRKLDLDSTKSTPEFHGETRQIREDPSWRVAPVPERVKCRKIDCGDVSPSNTELFKKALNSKANGIQVDFDDGHCPTWKNQLQGYYNIHCVINGKMEGVPSIEQAPILMMRPRAWNMVEHNVTVNGVQVPGPVVDFGLIMFHHARQLQQCGCGPFFYLSKLEGYLEARLWNEIFVFAEQKLSVPAGSIKACVLIENILATFEMEEMLYELKEHSLGLNCGIWDYCASIINKFGTSSTREEFGLPDRGKYVNMQKHFLKSYCQKVIDVSHRRGAHATGGMNAKTLPGADSDVNAQIIEQVCNSKKCELEWGVDGFLIFDADIVPAAAEMVNQLMSTDNQNDKVIPSAADITAKDLLSIPQGRVTKQGLIANISIGILFIKNWLEGNGIFIYNGSVEDSATAEISRSQVWQWMRHGQRLEEDNSLITKPYVEELVKQVVTTLQQEQGGDNSTLITASQIFMEVVCKRDFPEFITTYLNQQHTWVSKHI